MEKLSGKSSFTSFFPFASQTVSLLWLPVSILKRQYFHIFYLRLHQVLYAQFTGEDSYFQDGKVYNVCKIWIAQHLTIGLPFRLNKINPGICMYFIITLGGLIFAWIKFRNFANSWAFREN